MPNQSVLLLVVPELFVEGRKRCPKGGWGGQERRQGDKGTGLGQGDGETGKQVKSEKW